MMCDRGRYLPDRLPSNCSATRSRSRFGGTLLVLLVFAVVVAKAEQSSVSPRLHDGSLVAQMPSAFGGGAVVLELMVDATGAVARIEPIFETPPYTELVVNSVRQWRFTPATAVSHRETATVAAPVLVVGIFRPPVVYAGPAPEIPSEAFESTSPRVPSVESLVWPSYPPTAIGDGIVVIEIEISSATSIRGYRLVSAESGFDSAALNAVRSWRFRAPQGADLPDRTFVYALMGFRTLLTHAPQRRR